MKFKLDENLGPFLVEIFVSAGHDCHTVAEEGLAGASDLDVAAAAVREQRILVSLDRGFGDVLRFPPKNTAGTAVLTPHGRLSRPILLQLARGLLRMLSERSIQGELWVVEPGRIRLQGSSWDIDD